MAFHNSKIYGFARGLALFAARNPPLIDSSAAVLEGSCVALVLRHFAKQGGGRLAGG